MHESTSKKHILFAGENIQASVACLDHDGAPTFVCFNSFINKQTPLEADSYPEIFGGKAIPDLGYNCIGLQTNRNNWYQTDEVIAAIQAINNLNITSTIITYGSSMGGYAAINFASLLGADVFIAISPQYSVHPEYMNSIEDHRWRPEANQLKFEWDYIQHGHNKDIPGIVMVDTHSSDMPHAQDIQTMTQASLLELPGCGHAVGYEFNQIYRLKKMLSEVAQMPPSFESIERYCRELRDALASDLRSVEI